MEARVGRLKRRAEFLRVAGVRRKFAAPGLVLQAAPYAGSPAEQGWTLRIGFTASRRVGNAVQRNRVRRRLRAAAAAVMTRHARPAQDYVAIGRQATLTRPFADLMRDFETALRRLGAWQGGPAEAAGDRHSEGKPQ